MKDRFSTTPFDGEGSKLFGSRWSSPGKRCVFVADSEALAILEVLVHLGVPGLFNAYRLCRIHLPEKYIQSLPFEALPDDWREDPAPSSTVEIGDVWLERKGLLALRVPSTIAVRNNNFLLNPVHSAFAEVKSAAETLPLTIDRRLLAR